MVSFYYAKPVLNDVPWIVIILDFCNVCQAEKVITLEIPLHIDLCSKETISLSIFTAPPSS